MKYLVLIYHEEERWNEIGEPARQQMYGEYRKLREQLQEGGQFLAAASCSRPRPPPASACREGKELVTDGPFAETHEQLGGYFLIDVTTLDEAIAVAKRIPSARMGTVEIRPIVEGPAEPVA